MTNCFLYDKCNHRDCEKPFCRRRYMLEVLYERAQIPEQAWKHFILRTDADGTDLGEFQRLAAIEQDIESFVRRGKNLYIHSLYCGNGKAQPTTAKILTENGYVTMENITAGQLIFGEDGNLYNIIGKYDRGSRPVYKITFRDGTFTECCNEHLWTVLDKVDNKTKTLTLQEISDFGLWARKTKQWRFEIPITAPLQFKNVEELKTNPYLLGSSLDNTTSYTKFIPDQYKFSSIETRIELIRGLMDTDGLISKQAKGGYQLSYSTASKQLAEDFAFLIQSIGGTCNIKERKGHTYTYKGKKCCGHTCYYCEIKISKDIIPFNLPKKRDLYLSLKDSQQKEPYRTIRSIEYVGEKHCYCIMTDNPTHLYLTDNCIVTHNTSWALRLLKDYLNMIWPKASLEKCKALFISVPKWLMDLKDSISDELKRPIVEQLNRDIDEADLVVWDDVGTKPGSEYELNQLLSRIDKRMYNHKSNIFTTNHNPAQLEALLGQRLKSRICSASEDIELRGVDKRGLYLED